VIHQTNAGYLRALGIRLREGRLFSDSDVDRGLPLALVNETFVRTRLDGQPPLGRVIRIPRLTEPPFDSPEAAFEVVGVVTDTLNRGIVDDIVPEVYVPYTLAGRADRLVVLARTDAASITKSTLAQVYAIDKEQPATDVLTMEQALQNFVYAEPRFNVALFSVFAALGLILSVVGIYGVMASSVAQQVHEMGVRMAIGASPGDVFGMVIARGARLLGLGIVVGLVGSLLAGRVLETYVWRVSTVDWLTFGLVSAVLLMAGLQASVWPALRAARINPLVALRSE
jgi:ABC-type antimicrobial peptide transport system permease subunit